ncbi:MAG: hypothetical protein L6R36_008194 [Xanthoria steineri]|nr:MAG: hypothetical protein L6R36_008194 [Xanthoria steineri]
MNTKALNQSTATLIQHAKNAAGRFERIFDDENQKALDETLHVGKQFLDALNVQARDYATSVAKHCEVYATFSKAVSERTGELQDLDDRYQASKASVEQQVQALNDLKGQEREDNLSLTKLRNDLRLANTQIEHARQANIDLSTSIIRMEEDRVGMEESSNIRSEQLDLREKGIQVREEDQKKQRVKIAYGIRAHDDRELDLTMREATNLTEASSNSRDRTALCEALDSVRLVVGLLGSSGESTVDILQESRSLAAAVQSQITTLEEKLQTERETSTEHIQNVKFWKNANVQASSQVNSLRNVIISKEDAIQAHLGTIAERDMQIAEHLLNVDGLGRENQKLRTETDDLGRVLKERSRDGDRLTSRVQELEQSLEASRRRYNTMIQQRHDIQAKCDGLQRENEELKLSAERDSNSRQQEMITLQALQTSTANEATTNQHRITELEAEVQQLTSRMTRQNAPSTARVGRQDQQATETPLVVIPPRRIAEGSYIPYEMEDSGTISQESGFHQKRVRNDHTLVPGSEDVASKRVRFADDTEPAIHMSTSPSRNRPSSSHTDGFIDIDDLRDPSFLHANVPTDVVDRIRVQMESWDRIRPDWEKGTKRGELKCAHKFANHQGNSLKGPYACDECTVKHRVCLAVRASKVQIRPLANRGPAVTEKDVAFWVESDDD